MCDVCPCALAPWAVAGCGLRSPLALCAAAGRPARRPQGRATYCDLRRAVPPAPRRERSAESITIVN